MLRASQAGLGAIFAQTGIVVEPHRSLRGGETVRCSRAGVSVLVNTLQPPGWAEAADERRDLVAVAAVSGAGFAFWKKTARRRLHEDIMSILRRFEWPAEARS